MIGKSHPRCQVHPLGECVAALGRPCVVQMEISPAQRRFIASGGVQIATTRRRPCTWLQRFVAMASPPQYRADLQNNASRIRFRSGRQSGHSNTAAAELVRRLVCFDEPFDAPQWARMYGARPLRALDLLGPGLVVAAALRGAL